MSQHYKRVSINKRDGLIMAGWDKPTSSLYLMMGKYNDIKTDWEEPLILNIDIPIDRSALAGADLTALHSKFHKGLSIHNQEIPEKMWTSILSDIENNCVNKMYEYDKSGAQTEITEQPFEEYNAKLRL